MAFTINRKEAIPFKNPLFWGVLVQVLQLYARLAFRIYCRKAVINAPHYLKEKGPILFAANHPNSFLDGIILTTLFRGKLYSLARGDAFRHPTASRILHKLNLLPVYRTSEGVENLGANYATFAACNRAFAKGHSVMIFSEARCINEWRLRPLRKGTARLALSAWEKGLPVTVIPVGFNYNPFRVFGKNVFINFGEPIRKEAVLEQPTEGKQLLQFNSQLESQLRQLVYDIDPGDKDALKRRLTVHLPLAKKMLLAPFALAGAIVHAPLYLPVKAFAKARFDNDHFDSVVVALLMLLYPLYLLLAIVVAAFFWSPPIAFALLFALPFTAWACVQLKPQF